MQFGLWVDLCAADMRLRAGERGLRRRDFVKQGGSGRQVAAEETAVEGELLGPEGVRVGGQGFAAERAAVHGVDPVEREGGDAVDDAADGAGSGPDCEKDLGFGSGDS